MPGIKAQHRGTSCGPGMRASGAVAWREGGTLSTTSGRTFRGRRLQEGVLNDTDVGRSLATTRGARYAEQVTSTLHSGQEAVKRVREGFWGSGWACLLYTSPSPRD